MNVQPACHAPSSDNLRRPNCPRCGGVLLVAEESRFSAAGRVEHVWSCDDCGNAFVTSIRLWRR
jgi:ribosomal protein S27AE